VPRRILDQIRVAIRDGAYDMTVHAVEEMAEDGLDLMDVEAAILNGRVINREKTIRGDTVYCSWGRDRWDYACGDGGPFY